MLGVLVVKIIGFKFKEWQFQDASLVCGENNFPFSLKLQQIGGTSASIENNAPRSYIHVMVVMLGWFLKRDPEKTALYISAHY
ncbi:unnamed protein product [Urochloa humidicola]